MTLRRKIELIHAVKCGKEIGGQIAKQSSDKLSELKGRLDKEGSTAELEKAVQNWMESFPIVLDRDIEELISNKSKK